MYEVSYSGRVIDRLREIVDRNPAHRAQLLAAIQELDRRLRIYPQFGQPLQDLAAERAQVWVAIVLPLIVHYVLVEGDDTGRGRQVMVVRPPTVVPGSGIV